jgi:hypothetical protein
MFHDSNVVLNSLKIPTVRSEDLKQRTDNTMTKEKEQQDKDVAPVMLLLLQTWS